MVRHLARKRPARPAVIFALGPSGVGKTRTAEVIPKVLREFDDENISYQSLRLDMTEYQEAHRVSQLIGAPQGYIGHGEGSQLVDALRANPRTIVLFDEIEKAHQDVFNALLQILDEGRLTDGQGRVVSFRNTVIIMTSNVGSQWIEELGGRDGKELRKRVTEALRAQFRPEFLNRIDEIIIFNSLQLEQIKQIVEIQLSHLRARLKEKKLDLTLTDRAKEFLAKEGFDPVYGARPLKRTIQREVQNPLAKKLLEGEYKEGDVIKVDFDQDKQRIIFT